MSEDSIWGLIRIHDQKLFVASTKNAVDTNFAVFDAQNCACAGVNSFVFGACAVCEYHNNLIFVICSDDGFQSCEPVG